MEQNPTPHEKPRSTGLLLVLGLGSLVLMAVVVIGFQRLTTQPDSYSDSGLNLNRVEGDREPLPSSFTSAMPGKPATDTGRLYRGGEGLRAPGPGSQNTGHGGAGPATQAAKSLAEIIQKNGPSYEKLARTYSAKYPVIRQYGVDWMKYKDLRRFNDEYMRDRDPIKFARNVAGSPNFATLVKKYAHRPEILKFCMDAAKQAPTELSSAVQDYLSKDSNASGLVQRFTSALGLPASLVSGLTGGKVDPNQAALSVINDNPQLRNLLQQQNVDPNAINSGFTPPQSTPKIGNR